MRKAGAANAESSFILQVEIDGVSSSKAFAFEKETS